jgi:hypothetical protein
LDSFKIDDFANSPNPIRFNCQRSASPWFQNRSDGFVKSFICKAHKPGKGEAYFLYVEPLRGEV